MNNLPWSEVTGLILATVIVTGVFFIWRMLKELRSGLPLKDEGTQRVSGKAAYYSFYLGSYFMIVLMLLNIVNREFRGAYLLDGWYALMFSIIVQNLMYIGFRQYFDGREDF